jgi:hypothetical protein
MSVRAAPLNTAAADLGTAISEVQPEAAALAEGNSFSTQSQSAPLTRNIVVSIRASLNGARPRLLRILVRPTHPLVLSRRAPAFPDLCLQKAKGTWSPSPEALKSICKQRALNLPHPSSYQKLAHTLSLFDPRSPGEEVCCPRRRVGAAG